MHKLRGVMAIISQLSMADFISYVVFLSVSRGKSWAQREAYMLLAKREAAGLPLVNPNLVDPDKMELPSDEELGDQEIII